MRLTTIALVFVLALNAYFFFGQAAVNSINPGAPQFFNYTGSHISEYDQNNYTLPTDPTTDLPSLTGSISPTTGNIFTDQLSYAGNWMLGVTGLKYVIAIVDTVPNFLKGVGLPVEFSYGIGYMWYVFSIFVVIMFIRGLSE